MLRTFEELQNHLRSETPLSNGVGDCVLCSDRTFDRCARCKKYFCRSHKDKDCITPRDVYANQIESGKR